MTFERDLKVMLAQARTESWAEGRPGYWTLKVADRDATTSEPAYYKVVIEPGDHRGLERRGNSTRNWSWNIDVEHSFQAHQSYSEANTLPRAMSKGRRMLVACLPDWAQAARAGNALSRISGEDNTTVSVCVDENAVERSYGVPNWVVRLSVSEPFVRASRCTFEIKPGSLAGYSVAVSVNGRPNKHLTEDARAVIESELRRVAAQWGRKRPAALTSQA
jgi:hypothetical protein